MHILLVEDNEGDVLLTTETLSEILFVYKIDVARDGKQAIEQLTEMVILNNHKFPNLILLDINLPKKNGYEVLAFIKSTPLLQHIPVVMLSTSASEADITRSYKSHANFYISKPLDNSNFTEALEDLKKRGLL